MQRQSRSTLVRCSFKNGIVIFLCLYCDGFAQNIARSCSVNTFQHMRHAIIRWKCFFVSAHGPLLCNARGDVTQQWEAITWESQQIRTQEWSSSVFCAWSVPRGYKSQRSSVVRDKPIFSSERMLHKDYYRRSTAKKKKIWSWVSRGLTPWRTDWR
jgi:hypothetical protein